MNLKPKTAPKSVKPCLTCGVEFAAHRRGWCSVKCYQRHRAAARLLVRDDRTSTRVCRECSVEFSYAIGRGKNPSLCSDFCRRKARHRAVKSKPLCVVTGCSRPRQYANPAVCNSCYYRLKRTGTLEKRQWKYRALHSCGYVLVSNSRHPMATSSGVVFEHRAVLYDAIGPGPHKCHWCACAIDWIKGRCIKGSLVPDHLDGDKANNSISNLVPSCNKCNGLRGLFMQWVRDHANDPLLWAMYETAKKAAV